MRHTATGTNKITATSRTGRARPTAKTRSIAPGVTSVKDLTSPTASQSQHGGFIGCTWKTSSPGYSRALAQARYWRRKPPNDLFTDDTAASTRWTTTAPPRTWP